MKKKDIIKALEKFDDDDNLEIEDYHSSFVPKFHKVCGKGQWAMPYYCILDVGHEGQCYSANKGVDFDPD